MILFDTDVFILMELPDSIECNRVRARIAQLDPPELAAVAVITYEEQSRGRLATVNAARGVKQVVDAYKHLRQHVANYRRIPIIELLVSRNLRDFSRVPNLRVED